MRWVAYSPTAMGLRYICGARLSVGPAAPLQLSYRIQVYSTTRTTTHPEVRNTGDPNCHGLRAHHRRASPRRKANAPELVVLVRVGDVFHNGKRLERLTDITPESSSAETAAAGSDVP